MAIRFHSFVSLPEGHCLITFNHPSIFWVKSYNPMFEPWWFDDRWVCGLLRIIQIPAQSFRFVNYMDKFSQNLRVKEANKVVKLTNEFGWDWNLTDIPPAGRRGSFHGRRHRWTWTTRGGFRIWVGWFQGMRCGFFLRTQQSLGQVDFLGKHCIIYKFARGCQLIQQK